MNKFKSIKENNNNKIYVNIDKKSTNGITLVSLVITIVIMLILAAVSINLILGDNGLFTKTNDSAKQYSEASVKEELQTVSNGIYLNNNNDNNEITNKMIADDMASELKDLTWQDDTMLAGNYKGYDFYIDENHNVIMEKLYIKPVEILNGNGSLYESAKLKYYNVDRESIKNITIKLDANPEYPSTAISGKTWDMSNIQSSDSKSVIAYFEDSGDASLPYNLFIIGKKKITMPKDSSYFFSCFKNINSITGLENLNTINVENMLGMFQYTGYKNLSSLDLSDNFNTSNVTNMQDMFSLCGYNALSSFNLGKSFNTSKVTSMHNMFGNFAGYGLKELDLGDKFYTSNVTDMKEMFSSCGRYRMKKLNLGDNFNTENVTDMCGMFSYCGANNMDTFSLGTKFNTSKVTNFSSMFYQAFGYLNQLSLGDKFATTSATTVSSMFTQCGQYALTQLDLGPKFTITNINGTDVFYYTFNSVGKDSKTTIKCLSSQADEIYRKCSPGRTMDGCYTE